MRLAGYLVTLVGVGLVVKSIYDTRLLFGKPKATFRVSQWFRRRPKFPRATIVSVSSSSSVSFGGSANVTLRYRPPEGAQIEERVAALEKNVASIDEETNATRVRLDKEIGEFREEARTNLSLQRRDLTVVAGRVEKYSADGLDYEIVGAVCVVFGQALSSFPAESAAILTRLLNRAG